MTIAQLVHRCQEGVKRAWPIVIIVAVWLTIVATNYVSGAWLMGWDNVMPEFHFKQALLTNLFGVWQEHRGLGLYDGMGHAANLVHTMFLWLLSLTIPPNLLRYAFTFLMHLLGGIGAYVLLKKVIDNFNAAALSLSIDQWIALAGALFYQYNLATIQMFYTPLEAFSVHFAALPWLAWSLTNYLQEASPKRFLAFLLVSLLSTPQFFIPTLLLPVGILLGSITVFTQGTLLKRVLVAGLGFLLVNAFWLLPYLYGLPQNAPIIQAAKINQMSSGEVFARNQAFGDLGNILRLRGFPLDFEDTDAGGATTYLMAPWRQFLKQPLVTLGSWFLVAITVIGTSLNGFLVSGIVSLLFMANDTPGIKEFTAMLHAHIPFFAEAYRFPFTKFSLLFGLSSAVLFSSGLSKMTKNRVAMGAVILLVLLLAAPAFGGNFFSDRLRIALPDEYQQVFTFMGNKPMGRIAYMPQHQYWSWKYYNWGYRGSGFAWYGLPQPILDRAFDPWSGFNENYYWEISRSIYSKDGAELSSVLNKYNVRYVLLDENLISPSHNRALYTEEIKKILGGIREIREIWENGKLTLYEVRSTRSNQFITLTRQLPTVSPSYRWTDNDVAYKELGDYITQRKTASYEAAFGVGDTRSPRTDNQKNGITDTVPLSSGQGRRAGDLHSISPRGETRGLSVLAPSSEVYPPSSQEYQSLSETTIIYPFRSLFTKRGASEREFTVTETPDTIIIGSLVEATSASILKADALVYDSTKSADLVAENVKPCGVLREGTATAQILDQSLRFTSRAQRGCLSFGVPNLPHRDGYLVAVESRHITGRPLLFSLINQTAKHVELETYLQPQRVRPFEAKDYFILPPLAVDGLGYTVYLSNDAIGRQETINDIKSIKFYRIPYQELVSMSVGDRPSNPTSFADVTVDHPNPAYYKVTVPTVPISATLILSQSFDNGWIAMTKTNTLPFFTMLEDHVLVNNWANGWKVDSANEIVIFFWPQLLQWLGLALLPIPFLIVYFKKI